MTPIMKQWQETKKRSPEYLLILSKDDFYETFGEDAEKVSEVCGGTVTYRDGIAMIGFPPSALEGVMAKLLVAGLKVALCEEVK